MKIVERQVKLLYKYNPQLANVLKEDMQFRHYSSFYEELNKNLYSGGNRFLAQLQNAINKLFARQDILNLIAPNWIGLSADHADFVSKVQEKFIATRIAVNTNTGVTWNISYRVNWEDKNRKKYLDALVRDGKIFTTITNANGNKEICPTDVLEDRVIELIDKGIIVEEDLALYAEPLNTDHYIKYLYSLFSREVSTVQDMTKSSHIQWVMIDPKNEERQRRAKIQSEMKAMNKYVSYTSKGENVDTYILAFIPDSFTTIDQYLEMSKEQKEEIMFKKMKEEPDKFIANIENALSSRIAEMNKYIKLGLISRNTHGVYHDASDATLVLGNNMEELITYFSNSANTPFTSKVIATASSILNTKMAAIKAVAPKGRGKPVNKLVEDGDSKTE
jgi:hypothetical protein